jgi:hypothetical protein
MSTPLVTAEMLRNALSRDTYLALYDDEQCGSYVSVDASAPVALTLRRAHIRCISWLGANYSKIPASTDNDVPDLLIDAELNYAIGMSYDRHPEYVRQYGEDPKRKAAWDQAELTMMRVQEAVLKFVETPSMAEPENVGGVVIDGGRRAFLDGIDGTNNSGDF